MNVALIGVGLIGGSFAAALRAAGAVGEVGGYDLDEHAVAAAIARGIITRSAPSAAEAVRGVDLVMRWRRARSSRMSAAPKQASSMMPEPRSARACTGSSPRTRSPEASGLASSTRTPLCFAGAS